MVVDLVCTSKCNARETSKTSENNNHTPSVKMVKIEEKKINKKLHTKKLVKIICLCYLVQKRSKQSVFFVFGFFNFTFRLSLSRCNVKQIAGKFTSILYI